MSDSFEKWWEYEGDRFWTAEREDIKYAYLAGAAMQKEKDAGIVEQQQVHDVGHPATAFAVQGMCAAAIREQSDEG